MKLKLGAWVVAAWCGLVVWGVEGQRAHATEWGPGERMSQAVGRIMAAVRILSDISTYGYDDGISFLAFFLKYRATVSFERTFNQGSKYVILGSGDENVEDLDIEILDSNGRTVALDTKDDAMPIVEFSPRQTGAYTIRLNLFKASRSSFCAAAILRKGGFDVPIRNLVVATTRLIALCNVIDRYTSDQVTFFDGNNQWALYGAVLRRGEDTTITNIHLGNGKRIFLAAADENARDIDLFCPRQRWKSYSRRY
ncbi:MAG: hypothetical protein NZU63_09400 [Gemmataceae bacterium]|nr:hypothetical protein [Gemmataceae bacterium]MDW8244464.1 hypothetical protein [Thermogemmata sp.]